MSALGMASLGTQCSNKALGMASMGSVCGSVVVNTWRKVLAFSLTIRDTVANSLVKQPTVGFTLTKTNSNKHDL